jgi:hypothetical protein
MPWHTRQGQGAQQVLQPLDELRGRAGVFSGEHHLHLDT